MIDDAGEIDLEVVDEVGNPKRSANVDIDLQNALHKSALGEFPVNILSVSPDAVSLHVEPLSTVAVPVALVDHDLQLDGQPQISPSSIEVTLPTSLASQAEASTIAAHLSQLQQEQLAQLTPNESKEFNNVRIELPEGLKSKWTNLPTHSVQVKLAISRKTDTITVDRIGVDYWLSPVLAQQYDFEIKQEDLFLRDVQLTGPADVLQRN